MSPAPLGMRQLVDWRAAILAGLIAGFAFLALQMGLLASLAGSPWVAVRYLGASLLGRGVLPPPATFDAGVLLAALAVHAAALDRVLLPHRIRDPSLGLWAASLVVRSSGLRST